MVCEVDEMKTVKVRGLVSDFVVMFPEGDTFGPVAFEHDMIVNGDTSKPIDFAEVDVTARLHGGTAVKVPTELDALAFELSDLTDDGAISRSFFEAPTERDVTIHLDEIEV